jgi:LPS-assembly lipoprotein
MPGKGFRKMVRQSNSARLGIALLAAACLGLLFAGCGFHLRGQADLNFERVHVQSAGTSQFAAELRRVLLSNSAVELTDTADQAQVVVKIVDEQKEQTILSISSAGSVNEFLLLYRVSYRIMDNRMEDLSAPSQITVRRDLTYDDTETLGKESEVQLLFKDMQNDAVLQMLRRLSVISVRS